MEYGKTVDVSALNQSTGFRTADASTVCGSFDETAHGLEL